MLTHLTLFHVITLPAYGVMIAAGLIAANIIAFALLRRTDLKPDDLLLTEAWGLLGAFAGAKLLYLLVSFRSTDWRSLTFSGFNDLMRSGFVFYGGVIGGLLCVWLAGRIHKYNSMDYLQHAVFLIPFAQAFGRIGCFCAGCCYGIPWEGAFSVVFPEGSSAPAGIPLFPVQVLEAVFLFAISAILFLIRKKTTAEVSLAVWFLLYGVLRFVLEFFRGDDVRGYLGPLSASQWISLALLAAAAVLILRRRKKAGASA